MGLFGEGTESAGSNGTFDGQPAIVEQNGGKTDIYYGGKGSPLGPGHGHVVVNDGNGVEYWRDPSGNRVDN